MKRAKLHWFKGSTWNGQPYHPEAKTFCEKPHKEETPDGDEIVRCGACHTYQVTCPGCLAEIDRQTREAQAESEKT